MKIDKISIQKCGSLTPQELEFHPGINLLCGEQEKRNEMTEFLGRMLLDRGQEDASGVLWFQQKEENFRLTRNFAQEHTYHELMSETSGAITDARQGSLERVLQPMSEALYESSVAIPPMHGKNERDLAREIQSSLAGYEKAGDSSLDLGRAVQMLKMSRKGSQTQAERRLRELSAAEEEIAGQAAALREEIKEIRAERKAMEEEAREHVSGEQEMSKDPGLRQFRQITQVLAVVSSTLALGCPVLFIFGCRELWQVLLEILGLVLFLGVGLLATRAYHQEIQQRRKKYIRQKLAQQAREKEEKNIKDTSYREKVLRYRNLKAELREYEEAKKNPTPEEAEIQAFNLAMETIEELSRKIALRMNPDLENRLNHILKEISGGECLGIHMVEGQRAAVRTAERTVPLEQLGRPHLELIYLSMRLAAGELLLGAEPFFVLLTDLFENYSEEHLTAVFAWMEKSPRQFVISCEGSREEQLLEKAQIGYRKIMLV